MIGLWANVLVVVGPVLVGAGLALWGFTGGNRTLALGIGSAGVVTLIFGLAFTVFDFRNRERDLVSSRAEGAIANRAYAAISFGAVLLDSPEPGFATAWVRIKNTGRTPAYDLHGWLLFHRRISSDDPFNETRVFGNSATLGAEQEVNMSGTLPVTPEQLTALKSGRLSFFVWGEVKYRDAYNNDRHFNFKAKMSGEPDTIVVDGVRARGWGLKTIPGGETAN